MRISDWSSDVRSSDLTRSTCRRGGGCWGTSLLGGAAGAPGASGVGAAVAHLLHGGAGDVAAVLLQARGAQSAHAVLVDQALPGQEFLDRQVIALAGFLEGRSEEHTSELQSLMRISYAVFCLTKKTQPQLITDISQTNDISYK